MKKSETKMKGPATKRRRNGKSRKVAWESKVQDHETREYLKKVSIQMYVFEESNHFFNTKKNENFFNLSYF